MSQVQRMILQDSAKNDLLLTAVSVAFVGKRPDVKIKLTITLDDRTCAVEVGKDDAVKWSGSIHWQEYASVQTSLVQDLLSLSDVDQRVVVTFTISLFEETVTPPGNTVQSQSLVSSADVVSKVAAAKGQVEKKKVIIDKLGRLWAAVNLAKSVGEALSDIHPAIGAAMSALEFLIERKACESQEACRDEALHLVNQFEPFLSIEQHVQELKDRKETRRAVEEMLHLISTISDYIRSQSSSGYIGNLFGDEYKTRLGELKIKFSRAKESFDRSIQLETFKAVHGIEEIAQLGALHEKLSECEDAHFKSGEENLCLDGTRVDLLGRTLNWVDETTVIRSEVFWLRGKAGSGKSTIANTIAQIVEERGHHLSCFFCKRDDENLSNPRRMLPTLAYRFAQQHESYRAAVFQLLRSGTRGAGISTTVDVGTQFDRLFKGPLAQTVDPLRPHVVIIDALDECGSSREQVVLAKSLLALSRTAPWIKVVVTSRDEPSIRNIFTMNTDCIQCNIDQEPAVDDDIRRYIISQADILELQLSTEEVAQLVKRAEGLFIWCSTLFKYLSTRLVARTALEPFLSGDEKHGSWDQLFQLYDRVLDSAVGDPEDMSFMRTFLGIVNAAASNRPLSAKAIVSFMHDQDMHKGHHEEHARAVVKKLHAVLYVDDTLNAAIRAYHSSFYDFLKQKEIRASGWNTMENIHSCMFRKCIRTLHAELRFNICRIETPVLNKDIHDLSERIAENISEELQYSSRFWFIHLKPSGLSESDAESDVSALLISTELLFWLESLSLQGSLAQSLLAFQTQTHRNLRLSELERLQIIADKKQDWDAVVWERSVGQGLHSVAYSPNGQLVVCGAQDGLVHILDSHTGALVVEPLRGHDQEVQSLAFSPDGRFIVSGSRDDTVRIWDVKSGESTLKPLTGHNDDVICVAWSPNGQSIASGSDDHTIRVWNARSGAPEGEPLRGHAGGVWAIAYSPDGLYIASGGYDRVIRIWNAQSHEETRQSLNGHLEEIQAVAYSPDGSFIISGSRDRTIRVWNTYTGQAVGHPLRGHTDWVWSVMYSSDGRFILSSSRDFTIRVWDAKSYTLVGEPLRGHNDWVRCVSYSPDGLYIASASSDTTARVWDAPIASRSQDQLHSHGERVHAIAYSPDGLYIASGSRDALIRIWDAHTGLPIGAPLEPLRGHTDWVWSVAYSPDGRYIASGSADCTARIWDAQTGERLFQPLEGHTKSVLFVAYSPAGDLIASTSTDASVRFWNAHTGEAVGEPLQVHSDGAWSVAFSSDGQFLACGSYDGTISIWDISNGVSSEPPIKKILRGHTNMVRSVAFSPTGHQIASGSSDRSVRIWDVEAGEILGNSLEGHTDGVLCVTYSPNGRYIASSSCDWTIRVWDARTGLLIGASLLGHSSWQT
ncbi:hypothetical protein EIP86_010951 [Pleurotus ostreatoroseus]|nr:hypothetical protein EIP86_010951 [Pleurotus ostreatoroseus]